MGFGDSRFASESMAIRDGAQRDALAMATHRSKTDRSRFCARSFNIDDERRVMRKTAKHKPRICSRRSLVPCAYRSKILNGHITDSRIQGICQRSSIREGVEKGEQRLPFTDLSARP